MPEEDERCRDVQGRYYWPKIYVMDDNDAKAVSSIDHEDEMTKDPFNVAEFSTSHRKSNTRTAALPPHFSGFQ